MLTKWFVPAVTGEDRTRGDTMAGGRGPGGPLFSTLAGKHGRTDLAGALPSGASARCAGARFPIVNSGAGHRVDR